MGQAGKSMLKIVQLHALDKNLYWMRKRLIFSKLASHQMPTKRRKKVLAFFQKNVRIATMNGYNVNPLNSWSSLITVVLNDFYVLNLVRLTLYLQHNFFYNFLDFILKLMTDYIQFVFHYCQSFLPATFCFNTFLPKN